MSICPTTTAPTMAMVSTKDTMLRWRILELSAVMPAPIKAATVMGSKDNSKVPKIPVNTKLTPAPVILLVTTSPGTITAQAMTRLARYSVKNRLITMTLWNTAWLND